MRARTALAATILLSGCGGGTPDVAPTPTPSVLVSTAAPIPGSLPRTVTAYGSVAPALDGTRTFSEAQPGQVTRLMVTPGAAVHAGQALARFVTAPSARSSYTQAVDALKAAQKQRATTAQLLGQQFATQDQLVQADRAVADAQTALAALRAEGAGTDGHLLTAPFDGIVTAVTVAQGDRTPAGAAILTLVKAGGVVVTVGIDPSERGAVAVGQPASLVRLSGGAPLAGHVLRVDSALNAKTRLVDVDIAFPRGSLLPGEGMRVAIATGQVSGWVVPHRAVVTAGGPAHVFQIAGGKAKAVPVAVALASDDGDVVTGAIDRQRPLIVDGAYQVQDGDAVRRSR
ncbi:MULTISPECIES: efflux RND transporter periplasmic adaptor subunit [unclassified Sphingomonas]|uniref:efflux RND transporter periplasmic adaptor subunit n=1 Tax=unclassified Sphingomonas TaxID=196159 RepID=UPI002269AF4A|nr:MULTISPECIES: efflux RND transporter periplasmic adaptor subunit [unclassified Sphingomonas]